MECKDWTKYRIFLVILFLLTGSANTVVLKWADRMEAESSDGKIRQFKHPFLQTIFMFVGEMLCFVTFKIIYFFFKRKGDGRVDTHKITKGNQKFNPFVLLGPALCDMCGSSLIYIGLNMTYASSFQMLRGSVIIYVGLLSLCILKRILKWMEWLGIIIVVIGLIVLGLSDFLFGSLGSEYSSIEIIIGDAFICFAQLATAVQLVIEEKFVASLDIPPMQAVGWEGIFGFITLSLLQIPFYFIYVGERFGGNPRNVLEDFIDGFIQMKNNCWITVASVGAILSIAFYNFAGISITKEISATTRMVIDSLRTLIVWAFSLACFDQKFQWLQLVGFLILLYGMCLYNGITLFESCIKCYKKKHSKEEENVENVESAPKNN